MANPNEDENTLSMWWLLVPAIIISLILMLMYFYKFHFGLSNEQSVWGAFGDFFGGTLNPIVSVIAIIGAWFAYKTQVNANIKATRQFEVQNMISSFYSMLELHLRKADSFSIIMASNELTGRNAMKLILNEYRNFSNQSVTQISQIQIIDGGIGDLYGSYQYQLFMDVCENPNITNDVYDRKSSREQINESLKTMNRQQREALIARIYANSNEETRRDLSMLVSKAMDDQTALELFKNIDNEIYHHYGNEIGHYIRNIAQIMRYIARAKTEYSNQGLQTEFRRVFRAQLSRYELAIIAYNCLGNRTTKEFNSLVSELKILDDLYLNDLYFDRDYESLFSLRNQEFDRPIKSTT